VFAADPDRRAVRRHLRRAQSVAEGSASAAPPVWLARATYEHALALVRSEPERRFLQRRVAAL
jgi:hypothetical protein